MMCELVLEMRNIVKQFPGTKALDDVFIDVKKGEVVALLGENGAGKSTLMKILSGALQADQGTIKIDGIEHSHLDPKSALDMGICMIYQELNYYNDLSIAENIFAGKTPTRWFIKQIDYKKMHDECREIIGAVGIVRSPSTKVSELSTAERQLLEIAKAISNNIKILVMDEPTAALNDKEVANLFRIIKKLANDGKSVIYISHKLDEVFQISDRIYVLRDGKNVDNVKTSETNQKKVVSMMVGRDIEDMYPKREISKGDNILEINGLTTKKAKEISLSVKRGEVLGLFGLMGAGRTGILESIFGIHKVINGEVRVDGQPARIENPKDAIDTGIAYVPSERKTDGLIINQSVRSNITISILKRISNFFGVSIAKENNIASKWTGVLNIKTPKISTLVDSLSGGNQQKVVLAKWLVVDPKILLLNEPTRGIDVGSKVEIYNHIESICESGKGVVMISSELPELMAISDRILVISGGAICGEFSKDQFDSEELMHRAIGGV